MRGKVFEQMEPGLMTRITPAYAGKSKTNGKKQIHF